MSNDEQQACKRDNNQVKCYTFYDNQSILEKELRPRIVHFLFHEHLEKKNYVYIYQTFIVKN